LDVVLKESIMPWSPLRAGHRFLEVVVVDLTIELIHDSYRRWERGSRFFEAVEVDLMIGLVYDNYHRWERGRRFLL
jgi:hypothetical protein